MVSHYIKLLTEDWIYSSGKAWIDSFVLTLILPLIGYVINSDDPFYLTYKFPWIIFAPMLIGLRYGFLFGFGNACLLAGILALGASFDFKWIPFFPVETIIGMLLITLVSTEFYDLWQQRLRPLQFKYRHLKLRMEKFSHSYHILKVSHAKLENQLTLYAKSIRTSLLELEKRMPVLEEYKGDSLCGIGKPILDIFSEYCQIQTASLFSVSENNELGSNPIASLGYPSVLSPNNQLVREAVKSGSVTSFRQIDKSFEQEALLAIPLVDVYQKIWGIVIVYEIPMFAMQDNTLELLSLLGGHFGDLIQRRAEASLLTKNSWGELEYELLRIFKDVQKSKTEAAAVVIISPDLKTYQSLISKFRSELRELDKVLTINDGFLNHVIINLLPLTDEEGLNNFISRLGLMDLSGKSPYCDFNLGAQNPLLDENIICCSWMINGEKIAKNIISEILHFCQNQDYANQLVKNSCVKTSY